MDADDMQIDPAIAEAMGFSGFGMQTNKKRKHGAEDAFVDTQPVATGSNATGVSQGGSNAATTSAQQPNASGQAPASKPSETDADGKPTLEALRRGVRNAQGDTAYFLPSFIEDPWKGLELR